MSGHEARPVLFTLALGAILATVTGCIAEDIDESDLSNEEHVAEAEQPIAWNGHDYLFNSATATWAQAQSNCLSNGYHLVTIQNSSENDFIKQQITNRGGGNWWIGLNDKGSEGTWLWSSGILSWWRNWASGQPDNSSNSDCGYIRDTGDWYDGGCGGARKSVCEK